MLSRGDLVRPDLGRDSSSARSGVSHRIDSAKLAGVEPSAYLGEAAGRAIRNAGTVELARDLK